MRIDSYMTPEQAQAWWRANGREVRGSGGAYVHDFYPKYNTPQERYRLRKCITLDKLIKQYRSQLVYAFERGDLKIVSDIGWIRLASFYGSMVKSLEIKRKTKIWEQYLEEYNRTEETSEHRRIRVAARSVVKAVDAKNSKNKIKRDNKIVEKPRVYYRQAGLCTEGIY